MRRARAWAWFDEAWRERYPDDYEGAAIFGEWRREWKRSGVSPGDFLDGDDDEPRRPIVVVRTTPWTRVWKIFGIAAAAVILVVVVLVVIGVVTAPNDNSYACNTAARMVNAAQRHAGIGTAAIELLGNQAASAPDTRIQIEGRRLQNDIADVGAHSHASGEEVRRIAVRCDKLGLLGS